MLSPPGMSSRPNGRAERDLRKIVLEPNVSKHAEGSCLARFGDTHVLCTASVDEKVPPHVFGTGAGWVTAEDRGLLLDLIRGPARAAALDIPGISPVELALSGKQLLPSDAAERIADQLQQLAKRSR